LHLTVLGGSIATRQVKSYSPGARSNAFPSAVMLMTSPPWVFSISVLRHPTGFTRRPRIHTAVALVVVVVAEI